MSDTDQPIVNPPKRRPGGHKLRRLTAANTAALKTQPKPSNGHESQTDTPKRVPVSPEVRARQCEAVIKLIEDGTSEYKACKLVGIDRSTFRQAIPRLGAASEYARALSALAEDQVENISSTIADMRSGILDAMQARVEIDARKWLASKFLPRQYGDRLQTILTGADGGPVQVQSVSPLDEIEARLARLAIRELPKIEE